MAATWLTRTLGIRHPVVQAPMAGVSGGALAGAVSAAGGLGFLGVGDRTPAAWIGAQADLARELGGRFGIGLMAWSLESHPEILEATLAAAPEMVSVSFGDPAPYVGPLHEAGTLVAVQVHDRAGALRAADAGADILVAEGTEAGGHSGTPVGTLTLLQIVLEVGEEAGLPVLAAGGIGTGRGLAGVVAMGAVGGWIGTRFAASVEAAGSAAAKARLLAASEADTVLTSVFDRAQGLAWPADHLGRALRNDFTDCWHGREDDLAAHLGEAAATLDEARAGDDPTNLVVYAGQAVGLISDLPSAAEIVSRLVADCDNTLARALG